MASVIYQALFDTTKLPQLHLTGFRGYEGFGCRKYSIESFLNNIFKNDDYSFFVFNLESAMPDLLNFLNTKGWTLKCTATPHYSNYTVTLKKPKTYKLDIFGVNPAAKRVQSIYLCETDKQIKVCDLALYTRKFLTEPNAFLTNEEIDIALEILKYYREETKEQGKPVYLHNTIMQYAKARYIYPLIERKYIDLYFPSFNSEDMFNQCDFDLLCELKNPKGGLIEQYEECGDTADIAYDYDFVSFYPSILYSIDYLPDITSSKKITKPLKTDHSTFYYYVPNEDGEYDWDLESDIVPAGSFIIAKESHMNPFRPFLENLFELKRKAQKGSVLRAIVKVIINGFIGLLGQKNHTSYHYKDFNNAEVGRIPKSSEGRFSRIDIISLVYSIGRKKLSKAIQMARDEGAKVFSCNTDGFLSSKPLSFADNSGELGTLALSSVVHNLKVYASNQWSSDEEWHIAGLPQEYFTKGVTHYKLPKRTYNNNINRYELIYFDFNLGDKYEKQR